LKKIALFLVSLTILSASIIELEKQIYAAIVYAIFPNKSQINIWIDNRSKDNVFKTIKNVKVVDFLKDADIVFVTSSSTLKFIPKDALIFVLGKYSLIKEAKNEAIGGFFWQKGRPNIIFLKKNLKKHSIYLSPSFANYIEDEI